MFSLEEICDYLKNVITLKDMLIDDCLMYNLRIAQKNIAAYEEAKRIHRSLEGSSYEQHHKVALYFSMKFIDANLKRNANFYSIDVSPFFVYNYFNMNIHWN